MTSINGVSQTSTDFNFLVTPLQKGRFVIDGINVSVNGTSYTTQSHRLEVTDALGYRSQRSRTPQANPGYSPGGLFYPRRPSFQQPAPQGDDFVLEAELQPKTVYKHEATTYSLRLLAARNLSQDPRYSPNTPTGFVSMSLPQTNSMEERNGRNYAVTEAKTLFFPLTEGDYTFPAQEIALQSGGYFSPVQRLTTLPQVLTVLPLPSEGRPTSFTGAVGESFEISASVNKTSVKVGQTIELRVDVEGDGNLELVPYPSVTPPTGVEKRQRDGTSNTELRGEQIHSQRTYIFSLKMKEPGTFHLDDIALSYFRPSRERYETVKAPGITITVDQGQQSEESSIATGELPEADRPAPTQGPLVKSKFHIPLSSFLASLLAGLLGIALCLSGRPRLSIGGWSPPWASKSRPKNLQQLEAALRDLAPGTDSITRLAELSDQGWSESDVERFETLKSAVSQLSYGSTPDSNVTVEQLLSDFENLKSGEKNS